MLLFNLIGFILHHRPYYFNTSNVTIQPPEVFQNDIELYYFNTSNVTIQRASNWFKNCGFFDFNTSNVTIQQW